MWTTRSKFFPRHSMTTAFAGRWPAPYSTMPVCPTYAIQPVPPIHIIVKNGHVNLEGVVRTQTDKDDAFIRANGVSGVFSVQNNLQVEQPNTKG